MPSDLATAEPPPRDHLVAAARAAIALPTEERVAWALADHWIGHASAKLALAAVGDLLRLPRTTTSPSMLLLGRAGNGKTTILERFASLHPPTVRATGDLTQHVVAMSMPPDWSEKGFWSELLAACGCAHRITEQAAVLKAQAYSALRTMEPRVLICDELNNLEYAGGTDQRTAMAIIRELTNKLRLHLVLAGTMEASNAVDRDPQLDRRLERFELPKWDIDRDIKEYRKLLLSLEAVMPLPEPSRLSGEEMTLEISARTDGTIGSITRLVKGAAAFAIRRGRPSLDAEAIRSVRLETREARQARRLLL